MEPASSYFLSLAVFGVIIIVIFLYAVVYNRFFAQTEEEGRANGRRRLPELDQNEDRPGHRRRRQVPQRRRVGFDDDNEDVELMQDVDDLVGKGQKVGTKKLKKLADKEERLRQNAAMKQEREERAEREKQREEERKAREAEEEARQKEAEEEEQRRQAEKEKAEYEEYLKLKADFDIEETGEEHVGEDEEENLLQQFIDHIKVEKIVTLEDLSAAFKLRIQDTIDRLQRLIDEGRLTGVIDERGKFVYVSVDELAAVAEFIRQRGRVSFGELVNSSNLISMPAVKKPVTTVDE